MKVTVVSSGSPELTQLAAALAEDGLLHHYVTALSLPAAESSGRVMRRLTEHGRLGELLARRALPAAIPPSALRNPGLVLEVGRALVGSRFPRVDGRLLGWRNTILRRAARRSTQDVDVLVVSHELATSLPPAGRRRARVLLNMPTVDPAFRNSEVRRYAAAHPEHATIVPPGYSPEAIESRHREYAVADAILVGSEFAATTLIDAGAPRGKIHVVPYGAPVTEFRPPHGLRPGRPLRVLCAASATPLKGVRELVDACSRLPVGMIDLQLVGSTPHGLAWLGAGAEHHRGRLTREELAKEMRLASVLVLVSWFEGLPHVVLEAMASGLPCIVTARGADQAVRHDVEGLIVPVDDPAALAQALQTLADDEALRNRLGQAARLRAEEFTWRRYARQGIELVGHVSDAQSTEA